MSENFSATTDHGKMFSALPSRCSRYVLKVPRVEEKACWMIVAAVAGVWGQKDLWVDAADMLR